MLRARPEQALEPGQNRVDVMLPRRVTIIGGPGSGKSTLATQVGEILGLSVIHLDRLHWAPGWVFRDTADVRPELLDLYAREAWVIEGNYSDTWDARRARSDMIIMLDVPTWLRMWRVLRRSVRNYGKPRPEMAEGCPEQISFGFYRFVLGYARSRRKKALAFLDGAPSPIETIRLRGLDDSRTFLSRLRARVDAERNVGAVR